MFISGISGNELYCLSQKGFSAGELVIGNSVFSLGLGGYFGSVGRSLAGGEVHEVTKLIHDGRHAAINRMEQEAQRHGAIGVAGVTSEVRSLAGYTEFFSQGTAVHHPHPARPFFSSSASGIDLYCHLDAGYLPIRFAMGNIAYSLGIGRGISSSLRKLARGEVVELSQMYNEIRHHALARLRAETASYGGNAVVDVNVRTLFHLSTGTRELLMTGTASFHPHLSPGAVGADGVVTSELTGEELWNLARLGYAPVALVTATSVFSLGFVGGLGATLKSMSRGELPELTSLIYDARENCLEHLRREATRVGAERVVGNRLIINELQPGLIEVFAVATAVRRAEGIAPATEALIPQAVITDRETFLDGGSATALRAVAGGGLTTPRAAAGPVGCFVFIAVFVLMVAMGLVSFLLRTEGPTHAPTHAPTHGPAR